MEHKFKKSPPTEQVESEEKPEPVEEAHLAEEEQDWEPEATRHDLQLSRRLFHMASGVIGATVYNLLVTRSQGIAIVGGLVAILYVLEQIRINYPKLSEPLTYVNKFLLRAEERLKESSSVPYSIACLLCVLTFPKVAAVIAIYTIGISDPLSAIVGIKYGRHKYTKGKTYEGSAAFLVSAFLICVGVLYYEFGFSWNLMGASLVIAVAGTLLEAIPLKIDDNLTIPLFMGSLVWLVGLLFGLPL